MRCGNDEDGGGEGPEQDGGRRREVDVSRQNGDEEEEEVEAEGIRPKKMEAHPCTSYVSGKYVQLEVRRNLTNKCMGRRRRSRKEGE